jgi:hypothetical protein
MVAVLEMEGGGGVSAGADDEVGNCSSSSSCIRLTGGGFRDTFFYFFPALSEIVPTVPLALAVHSSFFKPLNYVYFFYTDCLLLVLLGLH